MYSVNAPVSGDVERLAEELFPRLTAFDTIRRRHALLVKRLSDLAAAQVGPDRLAERLRPVLSGTPAFEVRITGIDYFVDPPRGPGPVVYLAVESPPLRRLHLRLVDEFGAVDDLEGESYVHHVTLARGGSLQDAARLAETEIE
ncbi:MAG: 2'-5' RNA ligase family protein, partial [Haloferacaceae archaeon]